MFDGAKIDTFLFYRNMIDSVFPSKVHFVTSTIFSPNANRIRAIIWQVKPWLLFFESKIGEFSLFFTTFATILFCLNRRSFYLFDF